MKIGKLVVIVIVAVVVVAAAVDLLLDERPQPDENKRFSEGAPMALPEEVLPQDLTPVDDPSEAGPFPCSCSNDESNSNSPSSQPGREGKPPR